MLSWRLIQLSVRTVLLNSRTALKTGMLPSTLMLAGVLLLFSGIDATSLGFPGDSAKEVLDRTKPPVLWPLGLVPVVWGITLFWTYDNWHHFTLTGEVPRGWLPKLKPDRFLTHVGRAFLLAVIIQLLLLTFGSIVALVQNQAGEAISQPFLLAVSIWVCLLLVSVLLYRLSVIFPKSEYRATWGAMATKHFSSKQSGRSFYVLVMAILSQSLVFVVLLLVLPQASLVWLILKFAVLMLFSILSASVLSGLHHETTRRYER